VFVIIVSSTYRYSAPSQRLSYPSHHPFSRSSIPWSSRPDLSIQGNFNSAPSIAAEENPLMKVRLRPRPRMPYTDR
jgi:hypothetical protein